MRINILVIFSFISICGVSQQLTKEQKIEGLSQIWKEVEYNYPYFDSQNVAWDSLYYVNLQKVDSLKSDKEYFKMLSRFLAVFHEGHTYVYIPKEIHQKVGLKIWPFYTHNKLYVIGVGKQLRELIPLGSQILKVNDTDVFELMDKMFNDHYYPTHAKYHHLLREIFYEEDGTKYSLQIKTLKGEVKNLNLMVNKTDSYDWNEIKFPRKSFNNFHYEIMDNISYVNFGNNFNPNPLKSFESVIDSIKTTKGVIFDLRGCRGGICIRSDVSKYFSKDSVIYPYSVMVRINNGYKRANGQFNSTNSEFFNNSAFKSDTAKFVKDNNKFIDLPVVVLVNESTISEAETFIVCLKSVCNPYIIGKPSQGSATYPLKIRLPLNAYASIAVQKLFSNGEQYTYIHPDLILEPTIENILEGNDVVLNEALNYLRIIDY
nr:S41 family peptidase [uncultured Carboxylicivirga sp.]